MIGSRIVRTKRYIPAALSLFGAVLNGAAFAQITLDGSLGPKQALSGPNFAIDSTLGQIHGPNLFHSFGKFNIQAGQSATFTNSLPNPIVNILSRVTGGESSYINGLIKSDIAGANLYLFNPSGVAFGPNATLNVSGAFHVSTADYLRLADGGMFRANLQNGSVLTVAPPVAFGFMSPMPAGISFVQSLLEVPPGKTLSVVGGDIQMMGATLRAANGRLQLASAAGPGEVVPSQAGEPPDLQVGSLARQGRIELSDGGNATVSSAAGAGTVLIRSGRLSVVDDAGINANSTGSGDGAPVAVDLRVVNDAVFSNGGALVHFTSGAGRAGDTRITAGTLQVKNGGFINSFTTSTGSAGNLIVKVDRLELLDGGSLAAYTTKSADGGTVDVTAGTVLLSGVNADQDTGIFAGQFGFGTGNGGNMNVNAGNITIVGSSNPNFATGILGSTSGPGSGGPVRVNAQRLDISNNASISNATFGQGQAGNLTVNVDGDISIAGSVNPDIFTGIFANTFGTGRGGELHVSSKNLRLSQRASIQAGTLWFGDAQGATVKTGRLEIEGGSGIFTSALFGAGNAGNLAVTADTLVIKGIRDSEAPLTNPAEFTGLSTATGVFGKRGGNLDLVANSVVVTDKGAISSVSGGAGDAGSIKITGGNLLVNERAVVLSNAFGSGRGGNIDVRADSVTVSGAGAPLGPGDSMVSGISAQASGAGGAAGDMSMVVGNLQVLDGGKVTTQTFGPGKGGNLSIQAGSLLVAGINGALESYLKSSGSNPIGARSAIATSSERSLLGDAATGNAGPLRITGGDIHVSAGGALTSRTTTPGAGGSIDVLADRVTLDTGGLISAESLTSLTAGKAGSIAITARDRLQISASSVTTAADRAEGGAINIAANQVQLDPGTLISAKASGAGNAGNIAIVAGDTIVGRNSTMSTEATLSDGGNITLVAPKMVRLVDSRISTSVGTGQGKGGNITIDPQFVVLDRSELRADAFGGPGGNITIIADVFLTQDSTLSASSALSTPGTIDIQAGVTDISGNAARLPEGAPPVAALLRASCSTRLAGGSVSSLVVSGRDGLPPDPEGLLPSPLLTGDASTQAAFGRPPAYSGGALPGFSLASIGRSCSGLRVR